VTGLFDPVDSKRRQLLASGVIVHLGASAADREGSAFEAVCASRPISPRQAGLRLQRLEGKKTSGILIHFREGDRLEGLGMIFAMVARRQPDSGC